VSISKGPFRNGYENGIPREIQRDWAQTRGLREVYRGLYQFSELK